MNSRLLIKLVCVFLPFIILGGCEDSINNRSVIGSGNLVSETREIDDCNGVTISGSGNLFLKQDTNQKIKIEADDNIIHDIITKRENGILVIELKKGSFSNITLNAYVSLTSISNVSIEGSGTIKAENDLNCNELTAIINGSGNIYLKGECNYLNGVINGSGNFNSEDMLSKKCSAVINGSGEFRIFADEELSAEINGSGNIIYSDNPGVLKTNINGSGSIKTKY